MTAATAPLTIADVLADLATERRHSAVQMLGPAAALLVFSSKRPHVAEALDARFSVGTRIDIAPSSSIMALRDAAAALGPTWGTIRWDLNVTLSAVCYGYDRRQRGTPGPDRGVAGVCVMVTARRPDTAALLEVACRVGIEVSPVETPIGLDVLNARQRLASSCFAITK